MADFRDRLKQMKKDSPEIFPEKPKPPKIKKPRTRKPIHPDISIPVSNDSEPEKVIYELSKIYRNEWIGYFEYMTILSTLANQKNKSYCDILGRYFNIGIEKNG